MSSKYMEIYNEFVGKIENKLLSANEKLKSESNLMQDYGVSRDTIRKSLNLLEQNGYIQKVKGKGSFVLDRNKFNFPVSGIKSFSELAKEMGGEISTKVVEFSLKECSESIKTKLEVSDKDDKYVWKIVRVRKIKGENIILDKDYILSKYVKTLTLDVCKNSLYEYIENELGLKIAYAKKEITVKKATEEDKKYLDLGLDNVVVVVKSYTYLEDTTLFQYTESRHRTDKFKFVDFARR